MHMVPRQWNDSSDGLTAAARDRRSIKVPRDWVSHKLEYYWQSLSALMCVRNGPMVLHAASMWSLVHVSHYTHNHLIFFNFLCRVLRDFQLKPAAHGILVVASSRLGFGQHRWAGVLLWLLSAADRG